MAAHGAPGQPDGWLGRLGISAHRGGRVVHPRCTTRAVEAGDHAVRCKADDGELGLALTSELVLRDGGLLGVRHRVHNTGAPGVEAERLEALMPLPDRAVETLDLTGRWSRERVPQRAALQFGARVRESRRGRTGHDAAFTLYAVSPGFTNRTGQLWGVHVATSGNHVHSVERLPEGAGGAAGVLGGGELLEAGEIVLGTGEAYTTPWVWFVHSDTGLDGAADRFHTFLRSRPGHPRRLRPLLLNTWEAVYLDHDQEALFALASEGRRGRRRAFRPGRRVVPRQAGQHTSRTGRLVGRPHGLGALVRHVRDLGMDFGLWVEPEMANPDSELLRRHPEWILAAPDRRPRTFRHQVAVDLARPEVANYLFDTIGALVAEYDIAFLKWDHNRDIHEPVHAGNGGAHRQTAVLYALLDRLRRSFPRLEIEPCASGGARIDLGVLEYTDRMWVSDTNDPLERQRIQRWTSQLIPLELQGAHVGPPRAHTTGRRSSLQFRALTALFGHAGIEWDLSTCDPEDLATLRTWARLYRELRPLLHSGRLVHPDHADDNVVLTGVVAPDRTPALFLYARLDTSVAAAGSASASTVSGTT